MKNICIQDMSDAIDWLSDIVVKDITSKIDLANSKKSNTYQSNNVYRVETTISKKYLIENENDLIGVYIDKKHAKVICQAVKDKLYSLRYQIFICEVYPENEKYFFWVSTDGRIFDNSNDMSRAVRKNRRSNVCFALAMIYWIISTFFVGINAEKIVSKFQEPLILISIMILPFMVLLGLSSIILRKKSKEK